jgi:integrase
MSRKEKDLSQADTKTGPRNHVNEKSRNHQANTKAGHKSNQLPHSQQSGGTTPTTANKRDKAFGSLVDGNGISISEAVRIEVGHIDFENEKLTIIHLRERVKLSCPHCREAVRRNHLFCPTCGVEINEPVQERAEWYQQRVIPLDPATISSIKEYVEWRSGFPYDGPLLFPFSRQRGWQILQRVKKLAELKILKQTTPANNKEFREGMKDGEV